MPIKLDFPKGSGMIQKNLETTTKYKKPCNWRVIFSIVFCGVIFWNETANSRAILSKVLPNLEKKHEQKCIFWSIKGSESFRLPAADGGITGSWSFIPGFQTIWLGGFVRLQPSTVSIKGLIDPWQLRKKPSLRSNQCWLITLLTMSNVRWWSQYD